jgi:hypothetical protein
VSGYLSELLGQDADPGAGVLPGTTSQADPWAAGVAGSTGVSVGTGTGQHGVVPIEGLTGGGVAGAIQHVWDWINKPFTTPLSTVEITLIVGVILVAVILWQFILFHIRIAAETI